VTATRRLIHPEGGRDHKSGWSKGCFGGWRFARSTFHSLTQASLRTRYCWQGGGCFLRIRDGGNHAYDQLLGPDAAANTSTQSKRSSTAELEIYDVFVGLQRHRRRNLRQHGRRKLWAWKPAWTGGFDSFLVKPFARQLSGWATGYCSLYILPGLSTVRTSPAFTAIIVYLQSLLQPDRSG
jgi:hypothetical protein